MHTLSLMMSVYKMQTIDLAGFQQNNQYKPALKGGIRQFGIWILFPSNNHLNDCYLKRSCNMLFTDVLHLCEK